MPDSAEAMTTPDTGEGHAARYGESAQGSAEGPGGAEGTVSPPSPDELRYPIYLPLTAEQRGQRRDDLRQQRESEVSFAGFFLGRRHAEVALTRRVDDVAGAPAWNLSGTVHDEVLAITAALEYHQEAARLFAQDGVLVQVTNGPRGAGIRRIGSPAVLQGLLAEIAVGAGRDGDVARLFVRWDTEPSDAARRDFAAPGDEACRAVVHMGRWPGIRNLAGITRVPLLRPDGTIHQEAGWDPATGWYHDGPDLGVPQEPSPPELASARDEIGAVLTAVPGAATAEVLPAIAGLLRLVIGPAEPPGPGMVLAAAGQRESLERAALILAQGWYRAQMPARQPRHGRYTSWGDVAADVLAWAGLAGNQCDPQAFLAAVVVIHGCGPVSARVIARSAADLRWHGAYPLDHGQPIGQEAVRDLLHGLAGRPPDRGARRLGNVVEEEPELVLHRRCHPARHLRQRQHPPRRARGGILIDERCSASGERAVSAAAVHATPQSCLVLPEDWPDDAMAGN